jgi:cytochrome c oxidase subunit 1
MLFAGRYLDLSLGGLTDPKCHCGDRLHPELLVVGHFTTMFGGYVFPFFAALYYWFPKYSGRMYNEKLGKLHFFLMLPAFYVQSLVQMETGLLGMRRRIGLWDPALGLSNQQWAITIAGYVIGLSVLIAVINLAYSAARGPVASSTCVRVRPNSRSPRQFRCTITTPQLRWLGSHMTMAPAQPM